MYFPITLAFPGNPLHSFFKPALPKLTAQILLFAKQQNIRFLLLISAILIHSGAAPYALIASEWKDEC